MLWMVTLQGCWVRAASLVPCSTCSRTGGRFFELHLMLYQVCHHVSPHHPLNLLPLLHVPLPGEQSWALVLDLWCFSFPRQLIDLCFHLFKPWFFSSPWQLTLPATGSTSTPLSSRWRKHPSLHSTTSEILRKHPHKKCVQFLSTAK